VSWVYRFDERALKELRKLGHQAQQDILAYLDKRVDGTGDPRKYGKGLKANLSGLWRYRVGVVAISCRRLSNHCQDSRWRVSCTGGCCWTSKTHLRLIRLYQFIHPDAYRRFYSNEETMAELFSPINHGQSLAGFFPCGSVRVFFDQFSEQIDGFFRLAHGAGIKVCEVDGGPTPTFRS